MSSVNKNYITVLCVRLHTYLRIMRVVVCVPVEVFHDPHFILSRLSTPKNCGVKLDTSRC